MVAAAPPLPPLRRCSLPPAPRRSLAWRLATADLRCAAGALCRGMSKAYKRREDQVTAKESRKYPVQESYLDLKKFPLLFTNVTGAKMAEHYNRTSVHYLSISSVTIQSTKMGISAVPVTQASYLQRQSSYHIIQLCHHENQNGPIIELPVREEDNYVTGFRVLRPDDDVITTPWYACKGANLPNNIFRNVINSGFDIGYGKLEKTQIGKGILPKAVNYLLGFPENPVTCDDGKVYLETLFFMFGEGNRFPFAQKMVVNNIGKKQPVSPTGIMVAVIRAWSDISKGIMALYLAVLEIELGIGSSERDIEKFGFTMRQAEKVLKDYEELYGEVIQFRDENGKFNLKILAGGQLCVLKH